MSDIKIKTPYGEKNWSFVKRCFASHDALIEACHYVACWGDTLPDNETFVEMRRKAQRAISKAEGK